MLRSFFVFHLFPVFPALSGIRRHPCSFERRRSRQATVSHHHGSHYRRRSVLSGGSFHRSTAQEKVTNTKTGSFSNTSDMLTHCLNNVHSPLALAISPPFFTVGTSYQWYQQWSLFSFVCFLKMTSKLINFKGKQLCFCLLFVIDKAPAVAEVSCCKWSNVACEG